MEKALHVTDLRQLDRIAAYDRVYYGSEFCQELVPSVDELERVCDAAASKGKGVTLLTPYVTDEGLGRLERAFGFLARRGRAEVVFNDWGVFTLLRGSYPALAPVLGRLLTKQQRDPLARDVIFNRQRPLRTRDRRTGRTRICFPRPVPPTVAGHFSASMSNMPVFQEYLRANGVRRLELDNLVWDMTVRAHRQMGVSLHVPFGYITTTRMCGLLNLTYASCRRECRERCFTFRDEAWPVPLYIIGNAVFYESDVTPASRLRACHVDRLVIRPKPFSGTRPERYKG